MLVCPQMFSRVHYSGVVVLSLMRGTAGLQEVLVNPRALDLLRETWTRWAVAAAAGGGGGRGRGGEGQRESAPIVSPTKTTVWSSNNPVQVVKFSYFSVIDRDHSNHVHVRLLKSTLFSPQTTCTQCMYADKNYGRFSFQKIKNLVDWWSGWQSAQTVHYSTEQVQKHFKEMNSYLGISYLGW